MKGRRIDGTEIDHVRWIGMTGGGSRRIVGIKAIGIGGRRDEPSLETAI